MPECNPLNAIVTTRRTIQVSNVSSSMREYDIDEIGYNDAEYNILLDCMTNHRRQRTDDASFLSNIWDSILFNNTNVLSRLDEVEVDVCKRFLNWVDEYTRRVFVYDDCFALELEGSNDIVRDESIDNTDVWILRSNSIFGYFSRNEEGYFHENCDYICAEDGTYFVSSDVANSCNYYYSDCCDRYYHEEDPCACHSSDSNEKFDNTYTQSKDRRKNLVSSMNYTFGVELETCNDFNGYTGNLNLKAVDDGSISGLEYVSGVLHGNKGVHELKNICEHISDSGGLVDRSCGVHVHIGGAIFNRRFSIMLLRLSYAIQSDVFKMFPSSRQDNSYCKFLPSHVNEIDFHNYKDKLGKFLTGYAINKDYNKKKYHPGGHYNSQRYSWVNMTNYSTTTGTNTVEFRPHGGTTDFDKIYNWLLVCMSMVRFTENQQRRIWVSGMSKTKLSLHEVIRYSLNDKLYESVWSYCQNRAKKFGNTL
tara:strand:+ start:2267 stop:3697 length:1431 start_codon:yes stop_codon:yes gene_type:complete